VLAVGNDGQFRSLARVLDRPDMASDPRYATNDQRVAHRVPLTKELTEVFARDTADAWFTTLSAAGVPCGPINDVADAFAFAERVGLHPVVEVDDPRRDAPIRQVANPIRLSATPARYRTAPPRLGEDAAAVLE
jgi:crotonobetainyl-CoA:carnitine CoA-transferase CaiB-like acyl-CoA transferase